MAELFSCDVEQHVLAPRVIFRKSLSEIAHCCSKLSLRPAELLEHVARQDWIGFGDANGILQFFVVHKHLAYSDVSD
jgi:hypothetical protein